jgi:hypothetical protein
MIKYCKICGEQIPEGRLKALPKAETCVKCSTTNKVAGFRVITGKNTYSELEIVSQEKYSELIAKQERIGQSPCQGMIKEIKK